MQYTVYSVKYKDSRHFCMQAESKVYSVKYKDSRHFCMQAESKVALEDEREGVRLSSNRHVVRSKWQVASSKQ